jgi:hypothetical protein
MATSTLIQFLASGELGDTSNRRQVETFIANGAIAAGDWVQLDTAATGADRCLYVIEATAAFATGNPLVVGVALAGAATGEGVRVGGRYRARRRQHRRWSGRRARCGRRRAGVRRRARGGRRQPRRRLGPEELLIFWATRRPGPEPSDQVGG